MGRRYKKSAEMSPREPGIEAAADATDGGGELGLGEDIYDAEKILRERGSKNKKEYLIKWKNYDESHNSWVPRKNLLDPRLLLEWREEQAAYARANRVPRPTSKAKSNRPRPRQSIDSISSAATSSDDGGHRRKRARSTDSESSESDSRAPRQRRSSTFSNSSSVEVTVDRISATSTAAAATETKYEKIMTDVEVDGKVCTFIETIFPDNKNPFALDHNENGDN